MFYCKVITVKIMMTFFIIVIQNNITDILNGFIIDLQVTTTPFSLPATDGDVDPVDFSAYPVVDIVGPSSLQVERGRGREGGREGEGK